MLEIKYISLAAVQSWKLTVDSLIVLQTSNAASLFVEKMSLYTFTERILFRYTDSGYYSM